VASCFSKEGRRPRSGDVAFDTHPVGRAGGLGERRPLPLGRTTRPPRWWCSLEVLLRIPTGRGAYAGYSPALPLRLETAFPEKAVPAEGFPAKKEWEAALEVSPRECWFWAMGTSRLQSLG
jgi:hypothetical protein